MKVLQIILFLIANVVFLTQIGRHAHQVLYGTERSVLEQYDSNFADRERARGQQDEAVLLQEYRVANDAVRALEKDVKIEDHSDLRSENRATFDLRDSLRNEIQERERRRRETRDVWLFSGFGIVLIIAGGLLYFRGSLWRGFGILVSGFIELEYWASPTFFGGAADSEFHTLLVNKLILSLLAFALLQVFWAMRGRSLDQSLLAPLRGKSSSDDR